MRSWCPARTRARSWSNPVIWPAKAYEKDIKAAVADKSRVPDTDVTKEEVKEESKEEEKTSEETPAEEKKEETKEEVKEEPKEEEKPSEAPVPVEKPSPAGAWGFATQRKRSSVMAMHSHPRLRGSMEFGRP